MDFEQTWAILASAFTQIHEKQASKLSFEELYRNAYKIVLKKKGDELYLRVAEFERDWLSSEIQRRIHKELPPQLMNALQGRSSAGSVGDDQVRTQGERFLRQLKLAWEDHQTCMSMLTDVLMYMVRMGRPKTMGRGTNTREQDRVYCADTRRPSIFTTAMSLFRDCILRSHVRGDDSWPDICGTLNHVILDQIRMERDGDFIDKHLIKANVYMLEGLYDSHHEVEEEKLYLTSFEYEFLASSAEFYRALGDRLLKESDAGQYCRETRKRIDEENDRCRSTLLESTTPKIQKVVEDELIRYRMKDLIESESGVRFMITNERHDDLALVFDLEARVDPRKPELTKALQKIILEMGTNLNDAAQLGAAAEAPEDRAKAPADKLVNQQTVAALKWVEDVLELKDKFDAMWKQSFQSDQTIHTAIMRSSAEFINSHPRCAEYMSLFIDDNMKKGIKGKTELEIEALLNKAIVLLRYVQEKDVFELYYKKHLGKRLLMGRSLSIDVEKQMIFRMKMELGNNFTAKLEGMFKDMTLSEELTAGYKGYVARLGDADPRRIDLAINVLTSMTWPVETTNSAPDDARESRLKTIYPPAMERIRQGFENYYKEKYSGRMLDWKGNMGTVDVKVTFPKVPSKGFKERRHELNVSTYAMLILFLFNDLPSGASLSLEEIQARTNIPTNELVRNLQSLAVAPKTRILLKEPMSKDVKDTDKFFFNEGFMGKFHKVKIGIVSAGNRIENDRERVETEKKNNDSRGYAIEAAVVRIMKQRKELSHQQLVTETITQLNSQFKPDVNMIKKRIESLIEREYLERIEDSPSSSYRYLA
ncbi:hypothetical protein LTR50_000806 [Elasticomyces elasticus]|nr:hypothetical protein LTR50_000806 [Elasticomyces elasticus]